MREKKVLFATEIKEK